MWREIKLMGGTGAASVTQPGEGGFNSEPHTTRTQYT